MKRSEMLNIIRSEIYGTDDLDELCERLLTELERVGMEPPETRNFRLPTDMNRYALADELAKYSVYGYSGPYHGMKYDINEWEPENE